MEGLLVIIIFAVINIFSNWQKQKKKLEAEKRRTAPSPDPLAPIPLNPLQELLRKYDEAQKKNSQNSDKHLDEIDELEGEEFDKEFDKEFNKEFNEEFDDDFEGEITKEKTEKKPVVLNSSPQESDQKKFVLNKTYSNPVSQNEPSSVSISPDQSLPLSSKLNIKHETKTLLEKVAYFAITQNFISETLLMDKFQLGRTMAASLIQKLEYLGICGKNMGDSDRSVLVENEMELNNLLKRSYELNHLQNPVSFEVRTKRKFVFSKEEAEKGIIWSKILDEPRFKKHWTPESR